MEGQVEESETTVGVSFEEGSAGGEGKERRVMAWIVVTEGWVRSWVSIWEPWVSVSYGEMFGGFEERTTRPVLPIIAAEVIVFDGGLGCGEEGVGERGRRLERI